MKYIVPHGLEVDVAVGVIGIFELIESIAVNDL